MARLKTIVAGMALQLAALSPLVAQAPEMAQAPEVTRLFPPRPTGYATDVAGIVDPASKAEMTNIIERLRAATGVEIAVVTLPTIDDRDEAEVALAIGRAWGVGRKAAIGDSTRNAGMVILLVPRQNGQPGTGRLRLEVGQGLEGVITDATAGRIRRDVMGPLLAREEYGPGLLQGVRAVAAIVARAYGVSDSALTAVRLPPDGGGRPERLTLPWWAPLALFLLFVMLANGMGRAARGGRGRGGIYWGGGPWIGGGGWGSGGGWGGGGGGFGGFGGGGGFSGGGSGGRF